MATLREAVSDSVRDFMCVATAPAAELIGWLDGAISSVPGVGTVGLPGADISSAVRGLVCPGPGSAGGGGGAGATYPPAGNVPGQCELVPYLFQWEYTNASGTRVSQTLDSLYGPIGDFVLTTNSQGNTNVGIECRGVFGLGTEPPGYVRQLLGNQPQSNIDPQIISLVRRDGGVDDCGPLEPQQPPTGDDVIDYDGPDGTPIINVPITFSPTFPIVLPSGEVNIPIEVCLESFCLDVVFNLSTGDITFNFGGESGGANCCPPVEEIEDEGNENDPDPPTDNQRIWGVKINAELPPSGGEYTEVNAGTGPSLFWPDLGFVRFAIEYGGLRGWTPKVAIQTLSTFVPVNAPTTAYAFDLYERPGVTLTAQAVIVKASDET